MELTRAAWNKYVRQLGEIDQRAGQLMADYIQQVGTGDTQKLIQFAVALVNRYGAASSALAARFYDEMAQASGLTLPAAEPAEVSSYGEVAKAVNGTRNSIANTRNAVSRMVKQAGADTILKNAKRDGAEFAWVPNGDSCAFCITLASRGWQKARKAAIKGNHAEHIHANCDCNYCIRFNSKTTVEGYDPDSYLEMYESAEGGTPRDKINAMRRQIRQGNREKVNRQKREAYAAKKQEESSAQATQSSGTALQATQNGGTIVTSETAEFSSASYDSTIQKNVSIDRRSVLQAAKEGQKHRHGGVYRDAMRKSEKELQKSIASRAEQVKLHADKIAHPEKYAENWNNLRPEAQAGLLKKWRKDMQRNAEQAEIELGVYEERFEHE